LFVSRTKRFLQTDAKARESPERSRRFCRHRVRRRDGSPANELQLDSGQRLVLRFRDDRGGERGAQQAEHAEREERAGLAHPTHQFVGHVRHREHQRPVGARGHAGADGLHLKPMTVASVSAPLE